MTHTEPTCQEVDILVLGAGLAGLRAAWGALQQAPDSRVAVVRPGPGPSGSSFSNVNNMLGMQVCQCSHDEDALVADVKAAALQGHVDESLVRIMARESRDRFDDLAELGIEFKTDANGDPQRFSGCFSPNSRRAVVFTRLGRIYHRFADKVTSLGGKFFTGFMVRDLLTDTDGQRVHGALLHHAPDGRLLAVRAQAVIMALGGSAPLFAFSQAGPQNPGFSLALLQRAGVRLVNQGFMQFMWAETQTRAFWPIQRLGLNGALVRAQNGNESALPDELRELAVPRAAHCPYGHGLEDARLDRYLLDRLGPKGTAQVHDPDRGWLEIAPMAHAGNGGALIDATGATNISGLYACGECASGMHGANRVGGAMVLATQVFGERAGRHAAARLKFSMGPSDKTITGLVIRDSDQQIEDDAEYRREKHWLAWALQRCVPGYARKETGFLCNEAVRRQRTVKDWKARLALDTGLTLLRAFAVNN
ncbi:MAG: FAD-binding protein [Desulfovibrio sp.]|uniref:FAD-binding protein n=1 Tax=Desulfovibrio sp. 7SRBS1 TaxID=3378064 RepID=UPI003B40FF9A